MQDQPEHAAIPFQVVSAEGELISSPPESPPWCALLAETPLGSAVCNRGCGYSLDEPDLTVTGGFQTFVCPFGVHNGLLPFDSDTDLESGEIPGAHSPANRVVIGGRCFPGYLAFREFVDFALEADVPEDTLLALTPHLHFDNPGELETAFTEFAAQWRETDSQDSLKGVEQGRRRFFPGVLTGRDFLRHLGDELCRSERFKHPLSLGLVRVDMQEWAPRQSREAVRLLVCQGMARLFRSALRRFDILGFLPESERDGFAFIFPETNRNAAENAMQRSLAAAQDQFLSLLPRQEMPEQALQLHFGLAEYPADGRKAAELIGEARKDMEAEQQDAPEGRDGQPLAEEDPALPNMEAMDFSRAEVVDRAGWMEDSVMGRDDAL